MIIGKHDAFPRYACPDKSGKLVPFDPKKEWNVIEGDDPDCKLERTLKSHVPDVPKSGEGESEKEIHLFPGCTHQTSERG